MGMALPQFCCLADLYPKAFLLPTASHGCLLFPRSQLHPTSTLDLTASALWSPSSPAFVSLEQCRVLAWLWPLFRAVIGCFLPKIHLLRSGSGSWACVSQSGWPLCCLVSAAHMASCLLVTMASVQPRGDSTIQFPPSSCSPLCTSPPHTPQLIKQVRKQVLVDLVKGQQDSHSVGNHREGL